MSASVSAMLAVDIACLLICVVVLYANVFEVHKRTLRNQVFTFGIEINIIGLFCDILSWIFEGKIGYDWILYPTNALANALSYLLVAVFIMYVSAYTKEKNVTPPKFYRNFSIFCFVCFILTLIAPVFGLMFHLENGVVVYTELNYLFIGFIIGCFLVGIGVVCYARPVIGLHNAVATGLYLALPCDAAFASFIWPGVSYAFAAVTLSIVIVYVMMQAESVNDLEKEKQISSYYARHDELTGLLSRRSFNERMEDMKERKNEAGVIFMDMNGLKITNDTLGHVAGDKLLCNFAKKIEESFRKEDIYRIGGDEFVVIIEGIDESVFNKRLKDFEKQIIMDGIPQACCGTKFGKSRDIEDLIRIAEARMYIDKAMVHDQFPQLGR